MGEWYDGYIYGVTVVSPYMLLVTYPIVSDWQLIESKTGLGAFPHEPFGFLLDPSRHGLEGRDKNPINK